jgi:hypothetical protein
MLLLLLSRRLSLVVLLGVLMLHVLCLVDLFLSSLIPRRSSVLGTCRVSVISVLNLFATSTRDNLLSALRDLCRTSNFDTPRCRSVAVDWTLRDGFGSTLRDLHGAEDFDRIGNSGSKPMSHQCNDDL